MTGRKFHQVENFHFKSIFTFYSRIYTCYVLISRKIIAEARLLAEKELGSDTSGHGWFHAKRVAETARKIACQEGADPDVCEIAGLFHDIPDDKRGINEQEQIRMLKEWFEMNGVDNQNSSWVLGIISTMSLRGGNNPPMSTKEGEVVQDTDRLDAIGAIGIARTFAYSGHIGQKIYDPEIPARDSISMEEYRNGTSTAINHFYEKLMKLRGFLNTETARRMALERQELMEKFLEQFFMGWNSEI